MKKIMLPANIEFLSKSTTKKGALAEELVRQILLADNLLPYAPPQEAGAHPVDFMVVDKNCVTRIFFADVKCKAARTNYPDTGIDARHYNKYTFLSRREGKDVYLFFVDDGSGEVYGNFLSVLDQDRWVEHDHRMLQYPRQEPGRTGTIIYFPLVSMSHIAWLEPENVKKLQAHGSSEFVCDHSPQAVLDLAVQP